MKLPRQRKREEKLRQRRKNSLFVTIGVILGVVMASCAILNTNLVLNREHQQSIRALTSGSNRLPLGNQVPSVTSSSQRQSIGLTPPHDSLSPASLRDIRILVAIAAFDFNQIPHMEEVLDSYHDICVAGAVVDVVIHATVAYPVTFIDMLNSRFTCENFSLDIVLKPSSLRLHLVDCHRELFYSKIDEYDLFIYTEEDIQVTPRTVSTYLQETDRIRKIMDNDNTSSYSFSDFNVGIVRYEYNFPSNVVIDDKTRHAIQNVSGRRVCVLCDDFLQY